VRGIVPDAGTMPGALPTKADRLELPPQLNLNTLREAEAHGYDPERFAALVARSGLAMAPVMAAQANFRGILTDNDYLLTIARGDLYPAYADAVKAVARQILTSNQYAELELRGFLDRDRRRQLTDQHGMSHPDSDLLYDLLGRSIPVHQVVTGEARGGAYNGAHDQIPEAFLSSLQRGNLRPEYYNLAYANRYSYPSAFFFRLLIEKGTLSADQANQAFLELGWSPYWARTIADALAPAGGPVADPHVVKAQNQLWTTTHRSYVARESTAADARERFDLLGIPAGAQATVLELWNSERDLIRKQLTPAQIKRAVKGGVVNPATGVAWTHLDALQALLERGYSQADAEVFLDEPDK